MVELVDTYALGAYASRRAGSSPVSGTKFEFRTEFQFQFLAPASDSDNSSY